MGLLIDSYFQIYWPPLHSWLIGIPFLLMGPDLEVARAVSVVAGERSRDKVVRVDGVESIAVRRALGLS